MTQSKRSAASRRVPHPLDVAVHRVRSGALELTMRQYAVLRLLTTDDGPRTVSAIAAELNVEHPVVSRALDRLAKHGLASRAQNPGDARSNLVMATRAGFEEVEAWETPEPAE